MDTISPARTTSRRLNWTNITIIGLMHVLALSAFFYPPKLKDIILFFVFYLATGFGITIGFHRLLAHRSFGCSTFLRRLFAFLGTAALQGGPIWWTGLHRKHHQASDQDGDPHSPRDHFLHSHVGWMIKKAGLSKHSVLSRDLTEDRFLIWLDRGINAAFPWVFTVVLCFLIGGLSGVIWGGILRTLFVWHATWSVNSVCHVWGSRPHPTRDRSGNVWWVGIWALGEGWHNNHHAQPGAALHNYHWWEIDPSAYVLRILERLRLIRKVTRAKNRKETIYDPSR